MYGQTLGGENVGKKDFNMKPKVSYCIRCDKPILPDEKIFILPIYECQKSNHFIEIRKRNHIHVDCL